MSRYVKNIFKRENAPKIVLVIFLTLALGLIVFLSANLVIFYNKNIRNNDVELIYSFEKNTLAFQSLYDYSDVDISEQFLSYGISYGVDVSEWQGSIDWKRVASTGISFAMIRCGFRQTSGSEIKEDAQFRKNIEEAKAAGLKVGVYFFGTAKTTEEAIEEAEFTIDLIKDYNLAYPVVYDIESFNTGRLKNVSYSTITDNILTFTETVGSYGYETMVYSYRNALSNMLDMGKLDGKLIWLAHYTDKTDYNGNYNMWQYTSEGKVDGINGNVDLNISYFTYVDSEEDIIQNPNYKYPEEVYFEDVNDTVYTNKQAKIRSSATKEIPNSLGTVKRGIQLVRTGISSEFSRIIYDGRTVYIANKDIYIG